MSCYKIQLNKKATGQEKFDLAFRNFPKENLYKLFIDKNRLENLQPDETDVEPHLLFDIDEPGYYQSMLNAFEALPSSVGKKITLESIISIHDLAVSQVESLSKGFGGGYNYGVEKSLIDFHAFEELYQSGFLFHSDLFLNSLSKTSTSRILLRAQDLPAKVRQVREDRFFAYLTQPMDSKLGNLYIQSNGMMDYQTIISHFYSNIERTRSLNGKLASIAEFLRALEVAHFLPDGNQRTYSFLILNLLLIENGIPPVILEDPSMFDGYLTVDQLVEEIKQGIYNFLDESPEEQNRFLVEECPPLATFEDSTFITSPSEGFELYRNEQVMRLPETMRIEWLKEIQVAISTKKVNQADSDGELPLHKALYVNSLKDIETLLALGANPFMQGLAPRSLFSWVQYQLVGVFYPTLEVKSRKSPYTLARLFGRVDIAEQMLRSIRPENLEQEWIEDAITLEASLVKSHSSNELQENWQSLLALMQTLHTLSDESTRSSVKIRTSIKSWAKALFIHCPEAEDAIKQLLSNQAQGTPCL